MKSSGVRQSKIYKYILGTERVKTMRFKGMTSLMALMRYASLALRTFTVTIKFNEFKRNKVFFFFFL